MTPKKTLNILCFGDSLTEGYSEYGTKFTPYGTTLKAFLDEQLKDVADGCMEVNVCIEGVSGELVTSFMDRRMGSMTSRMNKFYLLREADQPRFDWVIFLGGTNDLGWGKTADDIWAGILAVTDVPRVKDGAKILLCTIPECRGKIERPDGKRNTVNQRIREDRREGVYVFDLNKKIPYHSMGDAEKDFIWDDGLHLTEQGYEKFGMMLGRRLLGIIDHGEGRVDSELEETEPDMAEGKAGNDQL